jgi:uncharacterized phosphosugar-binding protein
MSPSPFSPATAVNNGTDTITFSGGHGLQTGDQVLYSTGGGITINGLGNERNYNVIKVDDQRVRLGDQFDGASVNTARNIITFGGDHSFQDNDRVIYQASGGINVGGLVSGNAYY